MIQIHDFRLIRSGGDFRDLANLHNAIAVETHGAIDDRRAIHRDNDGRANNHAIAVAAVYDRRNRVEPGDGRRSQTAATV